MDSGHCLWPPARILRLPDLRKLPRHRQYQLDFGKAQWIEPAESPAPIAYFRKEIYLSTLPEQAWIEIAASDNFDLIVNGHTIGTLSSVKTFEAGIYDIKRALKAGTNVIAVSVSRTSYPGTAQLLIRGQIIGAGGGATTQILSDETWRVTNRTGIVAGTEEWNSERVLDQTWPTARRSPLNDRHVPISLGRHESPAPPATSDRILDHGG